jgi:hypothetical protein
VKGDQRVVYFLRNAAEVSACVTVDRNIEDDDLEGEAEPTKDALFRAVLNLFQSTSRLRDG